MSKLAWQKNKVDPVLKKSPELKPEFTTVSGQVIDRLYTSEDVQTEDLGFPGAYPFTRGVYPTMHRGRLWTMRQFAGFGTAIDTNTRFKYLLAEGQTGLSTAFHFPTLMGYDSDDARARGEVGVCGVAIDSLADMEDLFRDIPLNKVTVSMTINGPAAIVLALFIANAKKQGFDLTQVGGTTQNDVLKEYIAQNSYLIPPEPAMKVVTDTIEYCAKHLPKWNPVSISGYHIREAGSTAIQELAFTLADGLEYVKYGVARGMSVDDFAPRLSFFFNSHLDFFEEIAKFRVARRIWASEMQRRFAPKNEASLLCRFHVQTAGCTLTAQQPENNIIRTTLQALAAVLGGCQSLHTNSMDETYALPTEKSVMIALRTQQLIAFESGVTNTIDPLGGSFFIESLCQKMETEALKLIHKIDEMGGMVKAIRDGFPLLAIAESSRVFQREVESKKRVVVGVNQFVMANETKPELLKISPEIEKTQIARLKAVRANRNQAEVTAKLAQLKKDCLSGVNIMPSLIEGSLVYATLGEMAQVMRDCFGEYHDPGLF